ncbi:MAG: hypothetical protein EAZ36_00410 [Verrucomicrobia bacterium]|nr:MAG: hypothetical protein EAZ36_00410 [Verrucomicrobiota bacterium]
MHASIAKYVSPWLLWLPVLGSAQESRSWTDAEGRTLEASLVRADSASVIVRRTSDAREFTLPRARLSAGDLAYIDQRATSASPPTAAAPVEHSPRVDLPPRAHALNAALGLPLLAAGALWEEEPRAVASRLGLPPESRVVGAESWRAYFEPARALLDVPAYTLALRSEEGRITDLSIVFTNRGDHPNFAGGDNGPVGPSARSAFETELRRDFERVRAALRAALPGAETEPTVERRRLAPGDLALFFAGEHEFALQIWPEQMVALRIQATERSGRPRLSDERARQRLLAGVTHRAHGDVVIDRIRMVDQGPKGYCVPATFERLLRHAGIAADLYELAAVGGTEFGGGTRVEELISALERTIRRAGRKLIAVRIEPTASELARYIDEGRPVLWAMASTPEFNRLADTYSSERARLLAARPALEALRAWAQPRRKDGAALLATPDSAHLCLLIGYNRATGEIAFSDSWGPEFSERWLPAAAAKSISEGSAWVLDF